MFFLIFQTPIIWFKTFDVTYNMGQKSLLLLILLKTKIYYYYLLHYCAEYWASSVTWDLHSVKWRFELGNFESCFQVYHLEILSFILQCSPSNVYYTFRITYFNLIMWKMQKLRETVVEKYCRNSCSVTKIVCHMSGEEVIREVQSI